MEKDYINNSNQKSTNKIDKRVIDYIEKELKKGFSKENIKYALIRAGHHPSHIEFYFEHIKKKKSKKILISFIVIATLILSVFFTLYPFFFDHNKKFNRLIEEGNTLCNQGRYGEAMEKFDKAIQSNSTSSKGYGYKGWCFLQQNKYNEAIIELNKAAYQSRIYNPGYVNPNYFNVLGNAYCGLGEYYRGIEQIRIAIQLNSSNPYFYQSLGDCYMKKGDKEEADKYFSISQQIE